MITTVIFDCGGVICSAYDCKRDIANALEMNTEELSRASASLIREFRKGVITEDEFWAELSQRVNKPLPNDYKSLWRSNFEKNLRVYKEVTQLVQKLNERSIRTAVLSNTIEPHSEIVKKYHGYDNFHDVFLSYEIGEEKPNRGIYEKVLQQLDVDPRTTLFVDDVQQNLVPARNLGMNTILAISPIQVVGGVNTLLKM